MVNAQVVHCFDRIENLAESASDERVFANKCLIQDQVEKVAIGAILADDEKHTSIIVL